MKVRMSHLVLCLVTFFLTSSAYEPLPVPEDELVSQFKLALDAILGVGIRLQAFLQDDPTENFLVSPISAAVIIGQLVLGAEGEFREQLIDLLYLPNRHLYQNDKIYHYGKEKNVSYSLPYSTLHLQLSQLLNVLNGTGQKKNFILKENSIVFVNKEVALKSEFVRNLKRFYFTKPQHLDFIGNPLGSQKTINDWACENTNGLIKTILNEPPSPKTASVFANAIYFLAEWEIPFSDILNKRGLFETNATDQVNVTYMIGLLEQIRYAESKDYRMIALPYKDEELGMYILLPKPDNEDKYDIKTFAQNLKANEMIETINKSRRRDVVVKIPKMKITHTFSLLDQLKKYRIYKKQNIQPNVTSDGNVVDKLEDKVDAFSNFTAEEEMDEDIYLTNAAHKKLRIDDIVQQVVMTVNEKGTEAAVISASTIDYIGGSKNFIVDRPFVFFIRHEATSANLFWGTISNPSV